MFTVGRFRSMKRFHMIQGCIVLGGLATLTLCGCSSSPEAVEGSGGTQTSGGMVGNGGSSSKTTSVSAGGKTTGGNSKATSTRATGGKTNSSSDAETGGAESSGGATATASTSEDTKTSGGTKAISGTSSKAVGGTTAENSGEATGGKSNSSSVTTSGGASAGGTSAGGKTATGGTSPASGGTSSTGVSTGACAGKASPCPPTDPGSIAYIGCSMADNIGGGYAAVSGKIMWTNSGYGTGAMVVENWVENGSAWGTFNTKLNAMGGKDKIKAIMVQICILSTRSEDNVKSMIKAARSKIPADAHIYLVGQPQYEAGHTCNLAGGQEKWTDDTARKLGADTSIDSNMSYLGTFNLNCGNNECADACHANTEGQKKLGEQAKAFWGG